MSLAEWVLAGSTAAGVAGGGFRCAWGSKWWKDRRKRRRAKKKAQKAIVAEWLKNNRKGDASPSA
jgi:hypothetical protein